jgi:hypothetical protein
MKIISDFSTMSSILHIFASTVNFMNKWIGSPWVHHYPPHHPNTPQRVSRRKPSMGLTARQTAGSIK